MQGVDPYVKVTVGSVFSKKSPYILTDHEPVFNFVVDVPEADVALHGCVEVELWDHDMLTTDDHIGTTRIPVGEPIDAWFRLTDLSQPHTNRGAVRVKFEGAIGELRLTADLPARGKPLREVYPQYDLASTFAGQLGAVRNGFFPRAEADCEEIVLEVLQNTVRGASSLHLYDRGTTFLTNYRLIFLPLSLECPPTVFSIASIERSELQRSRQGRIEILMLRILGKTGMKLEIRSLPGHNPEQERDLRHSVERLRHELRWLLVEGPFPKSPAQLFVSPTTMGIKKTALPFHPEISVAGSSDAYDLGREWARLGALEHPAWQLSSLNEGHAICPSYPESLLFPKALSDQQITRAANHRSKHRLPALTWLNPTTGATLCRCAQPMQGLRS